MMKAPNALWSSLFILVIALVEQIFGQEVVATQGAAVVGVLSVILRMWQEREPADFHTMTRGLSEPKPYWKRVITG